MNKYDLPEREPLSATFAHETFSNSGFRLDSAVSEIIDNSMEANAKNITIHIVWRRKGHGNNEDRVDKLVFVDDGDGMNEDIVYDYFIATESTKRNNKSGIGKFGVGAYMACIAMTEIGHVYSKIKNGKWMYTSMEKSKKIPKPVAKDPPMEYLQHDHGTIVIWENINKDIRKSEIISKKNDDPRLIDELGRIYRKFISTRKIIGSDNGTKVVTNDNPVKIKIKSESDIIEVEPYDPLFITHNRKMDDTEKPTMHSIKYPIISKNRSGYMYVTITYLPESWWMKEYRPGLKADNTIKRGITERNEGISLVREGRELYFGKWPGGPIKIQNAHESPSNRDHFDTIDRWVGIEIEFSRNEDDIFGVEFNKTRIIMEPYVRKTISDVISPTIIERRKVFSDTRRKTQADQGIGESGGRIRGDNDPLPYDDENKKKLYEFAKRYKAKAEETEKVYKDLLRGFHISEDYDSEAEGPFVTFHKHIDSLLVKYNMQHPFTSKLFDAIKEMKELCSANSPNGKKIQDKLQDIDHCIHTLVASYGHSEQQFHNTNQQKIIQDTLEDIRNMWGSVARRLSFKPTE